MKWSWSRSISSSRVAAPMLPTETAAAAPATGNINLREATDSFQREAISRALEANQGNWAATARALELDVANLHRLAKRLGLKGSPPGKLFLQVNGADQLAVLIHYRRGADLVFHQPLFGFHRAAIRLQRYAVAGHRPSDAIVERTASNQPAAQVAVGENALHAVGFIADRHQAESGSA